MKPLRLDHLAKAFRERVSRPKRRATFALCVVAWLWALHWARAGTALPRIGAASVMILSLVGVFVYWRYERRSWQTPLGTLRRVLIPADRELGERAVRALHMSERAERDPNTGSPMLARLHLERLLGRVSDQAVVDSALGFARRWRLLTWLAASVALAAFVIGPLRLVEGANVLVARGGRAPLAMTWLEISRIGVLPPAYLRQGEHLMLPGFLNIEPEGSVISVRGVPLHDGRNLVLTDGTSEVPFVSDGAGGVVARWTLKRSTELKVAARFGAVLIEEPSALELRASPDRAPSVELEGAPREIALEDVDRLELRYLAMDDHGLRQVDLVLRSGGREERRVLSRLDGERRAERGGYAMTSRDPFLRRVFLPVHISVEARDNDPVAGPKWGKSAVITVVPPAVGAPEAARFMALTAARDALTDVLAAELTAPETRAQKLEKATSALSSAVNSEAGQAVPAGLRSFLLGQLRLLARPTAPGASSLQKTEDVLLAVDVVLRQLSTRDAQGTAKRLGDVAEEVADAAKSARESDQKAGLPRVDTAIEAVQQGALNLRTLGVLGADLGSVALSELGRVRRSRSAGDLLHAELAARHLADRLRRPTPSFGGGGRGGVESGGGGGQGQQGAESQAADRFNQLATELEQLANEHAAEIDRVLRTLADAEQGSSSEDLAEEARKRAEAVRDAIADLPSMSSDPSSARGSASLAREHGASMAQSLERLRLQDALESGKSAVGALDEAAKRLREQGRSYGWVDESELNEAKRGIEEQVAFLQQAVDNAKRAAQERARGDLDQSAGRENGLAERAGNLAGRGQDGEAALPEDAVSNLERAESLMRDAAREFAAGRGEAGLSHQRDAQRLLEEASVGKTDDDEGEQRTSRQDGDNGDSMRNGGDVPKQDDARRAEEFRRRVMEGLGNEHSGRLSPAVKRYAEGLLR